VKTEPVRVAAELTEVAEFYEGHPGNSIAQRFAKTCRRAAFLLTRRPRFDWPEISPSAQGPRAWTQVGDTYLGFDSQGHIWQGWTV
jgi:hypothetical protein